MLTTPVIADLLHRVGFRLTADQHSDVDLVVATRQRLGRDEVTRLRALHDRIFDLPGPWAQRLGLLLPAGGPAPLHTTRRGSLVPRQRRPATGRVDTLQHRGGTEPRPRARVVLDGPDPRALVDPVPTSLLRAELDASLRALEGEIVDEPDRFASRSCQGFAVLNACRMWCDLVAGEPGSKRRGAEWARARLDASWADLIARARETRRDPATSVRTRALMRLFAARCQHDGRNTAIPPAGV